jgi:hypothetical protein
LPRHPFIQRFVCDFKEIKIKDKIKGILQFNKKAKEDKAISTRGICAFSKALKAL